MNVLDLFSGIGGFSLGLERAGMRTVAFCEIEPYCRQVLAERWPGVDCYHDVAQLDAAELVRRYGRIDLICGGFPCQDISLAGKGAGLAGKRSGLWRHFARLIRDLRPGWVVIENVSALRRRGLGTVLADLAAIGYDAEWHCIPATYVGAPHQRDRIWIIAYPVGEFLRDQQQRLPGGRPKGVRDARQTELGDHGAPELVADADRRRREDEHPLSGLDESESRRRSEDVPDPDGARRQIGPGQQQPGERESAGNVAHADGKGRGGLRESQHAPEQSPPRDLADGRSADGRRDGPALGDADDAGLEERPASIAGRADRGEERGQPVGTGWWSVEPDVGRVAHGVPHRVDRLKALGGSVVSQIVEMIGRAILDQVAAWDFERNTRLEPSQ